MNRLWGTLLLIPAACSSGPDPSLPPPASQRQDVMASPSYDLRDEGILSIPPAFVVQGKLNTYRIRYYVEHHPGDEHEIPIVTIDGSERVATVEEFWDAMGARQKLIADEGTRQGRILQAYYHADQIRWDDTLDDRIQYKEGALLDLHGEIDRLARQIEAEKAIPSEEAGKKISFWLKEMALRESQFRAMKSGLEFLRYQRHMREEMLKRSVGGPEVTPKIEPRVRGVDAPRVRAPEPAPAPEPKKEVPAPEPKKEPAPEEKKPEDPK
jgi:hypothetical protein